MKTLNFNNDVTFYPTDKGWGKISELLISKNIGNKYFNLEEHLTLHKTFDGGYTDHLWVIIQDLNELFFNGQQYLKTAEFKITIIGDNVVLLAESARGMCIWYNKHAEYFHELNKHIVTAAYSGNNRIEIHYNTDDKNEFKSFVKSNLSSISSLLKNAGYDVHWSQSFLSISWK